MSKAEWIGGVRPDLTIKTEWSGSEENLMPHLQSGVIEALVNCAAAGRAIAAMPDTEVAALLDEYVLSHTSMLSPAYEVIESAVARLRRSGGGAMPEDPDDA